MSVHLRVTKFERAKWRSKAEAMGMTLSEWIRNRCGPQTLYEVLKEPYDLAPVKKAKRKSRARS